MTQQDCQTGTTPCLECGECIALTKLGYGLELIAEVHARSVDRDTLV